MSDEYEQGWQAGIAWAEEQSKTVQVADNARTALIVGGEGVTSDERKLTQALRQIMWIKDCGIDGRDEHGVFRNFPEAERDQMYEIAKKALEAKNE